MSVTGGIDWENVFGATAALSITYQACFLIFTAIMFFLVINIVVGMVIERAFKVVRQDRDFWVLEATNQSQLYEERVRGLFHQMDLDVSGEVSWEEFSDSLNNPHVEAYLSFVELDTANLYEIFQLLDKDGSHTIEIDEFIDGIHELRGVPTKVQLKLMHALLEDLHSMQEIHPGLRSIAPDPVARASLDNQGGPYGGSNMGTGSRAMGRKSILPMPEGSSTTVQFRGMTRSTEFRDSDAPPGLAPRRSVQRRTVDGLVDALS
jgi:Ca2+-binding EF-hand superfamily protein